jgi:hypothetical protein
MSNRSNFTDWLESLRKQIATFDKFVDANKKKRFWLTPVGSGIAMNGFEATDDEEREDQEKQIALLFLPLLRHDNVTVPHV